MMDNRPIYNNKMDSTMIYELIQQQLHSEGQLLNLLPTLGRLIAPRTRFSTERMNDQQIFAQVYGCVQNLLTQKQQEKELLIGNIGEENVEQSEPEQSNQENNEMQEEVEQDEEEQQQQQFDEENQEAGEDQEEQGQDGEEQLIDDLGDEQVIGDEDDVGLYGQQIDEEEMESYENQGDSQEDKQFQEEEKLVTKRLKGKKHQEEDIEDQGDDLINDQFDHFREIQMQNKEEDVTVPEEKNDLQKQIERLESKIISKKDWMLQGQVKATQRPVNSLLEQDLQFKTGIRLGQQITPQYNEDLEKMIKQRILDEIFDDRVRFQPSQALREQFGSLKQVSTEKSKQGLAELYESQFKNFLGLGQNKQDKLRAQIMQSFKEVNYFLDSLSNFHFTPRPRAALKGQAVIVEERVPTARWKGQGEVSEIKNRFQSQKEQNKKEKRVKNKRIARQRRKEQSRKKLNKKIEYGGMTKFQAKASAKTKKNNLNTTNVKYNQSAKFFGEMNNDKSKKPNPNISKLKV